MKKIVLIVALVFVSTLVPAQMFDSIPIQNIRNYYLYNWPRNVDTVYCDDDGYPHPFAFYPEGLGITEVARYQYTSSPLTIIGLAAVGIWYPTTYAFENDTFEIGDNLMDIYPDRSVWHELLRLYKPENDSMILKASCMINATPKAYSFSPWNNPMSIDSACEEHTSNTAWPRGGLEWKFYNLYEGFFEKPIEVTDSFYISVGRTCYFMEVHDSEEGYNLYSTGKFLPGGYHLPCPMYQCWAKDKFRLHPSSGDTNTWYGHAPTQGPDPWFNQTLSEEEAASFYIADGEGAREWHFSRYFRCAYIPMVFPIIDTLPLSVYDTFACPEPVGLRVQDQSDDCAVITWGSHTDHRAWQFVSVPDGGNPDDAVPIICNNPMRSLCGMVPGEVYTAYVRALCHHRDSVYYSDWVRLDSIYIGMPVDGQTTNIERSMVDQLTQMMPNPANDEVCVMSSFNLRSVEVFDLQGRPLNHSEVDGHVFTFNVSGWKPGLYLVNIHTSQGTTVRKLVVQ